MTTNDDDRRRSYEHDDAYWDLFTQQREREADERWKAEQDEAALEGWKP